MSLNVLSYLNALHDNLDPVSRKPLGEQSAFATEPVRAAITALLLAIRKHEAPQVSATLDDKNVLDLVHSLKAIGYHPNSLQLTHIYRGSKRIIDPEIKALPQFGSLRSTYTQSALQQYLLDFAERRPAYFTIQETSKRKAKPWNDELFFKEKKFDKLEASQFTKFQEEILKLGLLLDNENTPPFILAGRKRYPRAFEPWTAAERGLLLEAMCYTNQSSRLVEIFGRSAKSIENEGKRLIYESRKKYAAMATDNHIAEDRIVEYQHNRRA